MKKSERFLLALFGLTFLIIIGGGLGNFAWSNLQDIRAENERLRDRLVEMNQAIAQGADWQIKSDWLEAHVPACASRQDASSKLLNAIQKEAEKTGLAIGGKEFMEPAREMGPDGLPVDGPIGYFDQATVKVTLTNVKEQALFAWMHAVQQPAAFLGVTRLQMTPSGQGKTVNAEVDVTQYYREKPATKLTRTP